MGRSFTVVDTRRNYVGSGRVIYNQLFVVDFRLSFLWETTASRVLPEFTGQL